MDAMDALVKHLARTTFEDLPAEVVAVAKTSILDTIGVTIAGSVSEGCKLLIDYIHEWEGRKESTIAVFGGKAPCALAAQANGAMARAFELDDVLDCFPLHPSASIVPLCLAVAERQGKVNGKAFITAVALAQDLMVRLALSVKTSPILSGRYNLFEVFALAGAAGKLMNLTEDQLLNGMGIVYSQMAADAKAPRDGVMTGYIQQGTRAKSAIEAALMAEKGITGTKDVLEGQYGFYQAYEPDPNTDAIHADLGKIFRGLDLSIKLHSACRCTHLSIDLAQSARQKGLNADEIEHIKVRVNDQTWNLVCNPVELRRKPTTHVDAQFSLPYTVAAAIIKGSVFIDEVSDQAIHDPHILELAQRITPVFDAERQSELAVGSVIMEILTKSHDTVVVNADFPKGNPKNPASQDDCVTKFRKCVAFSAIPFPEEQVNSIIRFIDDLERVNDVSQLAPFLVAAPGQGGL
jgi:2-methylcitrate dehydratase PrpD